MDKLELQMPVVVRADEIEICIFEIRDHAASLRFGFLRADHTLTHAENADLLHLSAWVSARSNLRPIYS